MINSQTEVFLTNTVLYLKKQFFTNYSLQRNMFTLKLIEICTLTELYCYESWSEPPKMRFKADF